jgi:hypothetical protein
MSWGVMNVILSLSSGCSRGRKVERYQRSIPQPGRCEEEGRDPSGSVLTVNSCIKVHLDLQTHKSPVVVKGPFFPRVVNPRYRIRGTMCDAKDDLVKPSNFNLRYRETLMHLDTTQN